MHTSQAFVSLRDTMRGGRLIRRVVWNVIRMRNIASSLWASVQGDPVFMRRVNGWLTLFWIAMIPVSLVTGWIHSVAFIAALSIWALVAGHWSTWQAARVEVTQQREAEEREKQPVEEKVVDALVANTNVEPAKANGQSR